MRVDSVQDACTRQLLGTRHKAGPTHHTEITHTGYTLRHTARHERGNRKNGEINVPRASDSATHAAANSRSIHCQITRGRFAEFLLCPQRLEPNPVWFQ